MWARGPPQLFRDDPELGRLDREPLRFRPLLLDPGAAAVHPARLVPDDLAAVELAAEDLADGRRRPAARAPRRHALRSERFRDPDEAPLGGRPLEDPPDHAACSGLTWRKDVLPPALPVSARG